MPSPFLPLNFGGQFIQPGAGGVNGVVSGSSLYRGLGPGGGTNYLDFSGGRGSAGYGQMRQAGVSGREGAGLTDAGNQYNTYGAPGSGAMWSDAGPRNPWGVGDNGQASADATAAQFARGGTGQGPLSWMNALATKTAADADAKMRESARQKQAEADQQGFTAPQAPFAYGSLGGGGGGYGGGFGGGYGGGGLSYASMGLTPQLEGMRAQSLRDAFYTPYLGRR